MKYVAILAFYLVAFTVSASELTGSFYLFEYEDDQHYRVSFGSKKLTWWGVKGRDAGRTGTDSYQHFKIGHRVYMVQWPEEDGTFVTVVIDDEKKRVWSSGIAQNTTWFRKGDITLSGRMAFYGI